jgi:hypothetical protein
MGLKEDLILGVIFLSLSVLLGIRVEIREGLLIGVVLRAIDAHLAD